MGKVMVKYKLVYFGGEWMLYERFAEWEILLFHNKNRDTVIKYMDADARGDKRTTMDMRYAAARMCRGF